MIQYEMPELYNICSDLLVRPLLQEWRYFGILMGFLTWTTHFRLDKVLRMEFIICPFPKRTRLISNISSILVSSVQNIFPTLPVIFIKLQTGSTISGWQCLLTVLPRTPLLFRVLLLVESCMMTHSVPLLPSHVACTCYCKNVQFTDLFHNLIT